jgi:hypothetical protein
LSGTIGFFASSTVGVTVRSDKDSMFAYYSFPLRVGSDAIQYRIEGAMKRTEKRPQITNYTVRALDAVTLESSHLLRVSEPLLLHNFHQSYSCSSRFL